ncbi:MAG: AIR carboxylase family protein [Candidatus Limnocylindrales bacterium]
MGVGNARNAAILAAQILAISDPTIAASVDAFRTAQTRKILDDPTNQPG